MYQKYHGEKSLKSDPLLGKAPESILGVAELMSECFALPTLWEASDTLARSRKERKPAFSLCPEDTSGFSAKAAACPQSGNPVELSISV